MFTKKEQSFFNDPYFRVIREEEQFIEIQSLNTKHCWNVFKNQFEPEFKITLYHKHKASDEYYHKHRQCRTVSEAVKQIKDHDEYVLEQIAQKEKKAQEVTEQPSRQLKVYKTSGYNYKPTPTIILKGDWLKGWGFESGTAVNVECQGDGKLTITVV